MKPEKCLGRIHELQSLGKTKDQDKGWSLTCRKYVNCRVNGVG